jgi:hypothetical protein
VTIHENSSATKASAPYLGSYIPKETLRLEQFSESVAAKCGLPKIQVEAILGGAFDAIAELERDSLVRVHTHLGVVCGVIRGSFPTSDAPFDPARNSLVLALRLWDDLKLDLVDVTPAIITDSSLTKLRVDNAMDIAVQKPMNLIHGNHVFRVAGFNMVLDDEGATAYLENALGTTFPLVIDEVVSKQLFKAHTAELLPGGDYKLVVKSRAGDAAGPLQTSFRKVKYLRVVDPEPPPAPTITEVRQYGSSEANLISNMGGDVNIAGTNLAGARVYWTYTDTATSEPTTVEVDGGFLNVDDTVINMTPSGVAQIGAMDSGTVVLTVTTAGGTAEQTCQFSYE